MKDEKHVFSFCTVSPELSGTFGIFPLDSAPSVLLLIHCREPGHVGRSPLHGSVLFSGVSGQIPLAPYARCNCELDLKVQQEHII